jgi:hypothetical protein
MNEYTFRKRIFGRKREEEEDDEDGGGGGGGGGGGDAGGWRKCTVRTFITSVLHQDHQMKNEMGGACSTYGRDKKCVQ